MTATFSDVLQASAGAFARPAHDVDGRDGSRACSALPVNGSQRSDAEVIGAAEEQAKRVESLLGAEPAVEAPCLSGSEWAWRGPQLPQDAHVLMSRRFVGTWVGAAGRLRLARM